MSAPALHSSLDDAFSKSSNEEMTLGQFKFIWTMEYLHRMWGRGIGLAFLLPCAYFWRRGRFSAAMKKRMVLAGSLILAQGLVGWWMVKSGLNPEHNSNQDVPRVSQYRLTAHLSMAFVLYTIFLWTGLSHVLKPVDVSLPARVPSSLPDSTPHWRASAGCAA